MLDQSVLATLRQRAQPAQSVLPVDRESAIGSRTNTERENERVLSLLKLVRFEDLRIRAARVRLPPGLQARDP